MKWGSPSSLLAPVHFDFADLQAFDILGRTAAFAKMVLGGMVLERAVALSGLGAGE